MRRLSTACVTGFAACLFALAVTAAAAQDAATSPEALFDQARREAAAGQLRQAQKTLVGAIRRKREVDGGERAGIAQYYVLLGDLLQRGGDAAKAEPLYRRALEAAATAAEDAAGAGLRALIHGRLARVAMRAGRDAAAEREFMAALDWGGRAHGPDGAALLGDRLQLARLLTRKFELDRARALLEQAERSLPSAPGDPAGRAQVEQEWGEWNFRQGRDREALKHYRASLALREQSAGPDSLEAAQSLSSLAPVLSNMALYRQAEEAFLRGTAIYQARLGADHEFIAPLLINLGQLYYQQNRFQESETALVRARKIIEARLGAAHPSMATVSNHLGYLYLQIGRYDLARKNLTAAMAIWTDAKTARPRYAANANSLLGAVARREGHLDEASRILENAVARLGAIYGADNPALGDAVHELALTRWQAGKISEAEIEFRRAIAVWESIGPTHYNAIQVRADLVRFLDDQGRDDEALTEARTATAALGVHIRRSTGERTRSLAAQISALRGAVIAHVRVLDNLARAHPERAAAYLAESFEVGQEARATSAAQALAQLGARFHRGGGLSTLIRLRQDLAERWREVDAKLAEAITQSARQRNLATEAALHAEAEQLRAGIAAKDSEIAAFDPEYAQLVKSRQVAPADVQSVLGRDEAMLVYLIGETESFVWVLRRDALSLHALAVTGDQLEQTVRRLRRSLSPRGIKSYDQIRPFPVAMAARLYRQVVGPLEAEIAGAAHVMIVPDGALQSLPFAVLVKDGKVKPRQLADHRSVDWLVKHVALSTLPSVGSLRVLRQLVRDRPSGARPFIGIGDPKMSSAADGLPELPETANELRRVASTLNAGEGALLLRADATEENLRRQSLDQFRIVQFATHGLMAGEFQGLREPALVLTAPDHIRSAQNDGLLTSAEIAQLRLNARWVILSACNTAGPNGAPGAEGLSGLGKAFFFAGTRSLLVSHWEVVSEAAVELTTRMLEVQDRDPALSGAEALRRSILALMSREESPHFAHPMFWAPFVVVGEGGASR